MYYFAASSIIRGAHHVRMRGENKQCAAENVGGGKRF